MANLTNLARTLAERLMNEMGYCQPEERCEICQSRIIQAEAVIREAIEKTIEEAASAGALAGGKWGQDVRSHIEALKP